MAEATACVNEETRITLCSIRATKGNPPFSGSVGERKLMTHFVVGPSFNVWNDCNVWNDWNPRNAFNFALRGEFSAIDSPSSNFALGSARIQRVHHQTLMMSRRAEVLVECMG